MNNKQIRFYLLIGLFILVLIGCSSSNKQTDSLNKSVDLKQRGNEISKLIKADGIKDMEIIQADRDMVVLKNKQCQIAIDFKDNKIKHIKSSMIDYDHDDYSCVFRTLFKDQDLLGNDSQKYEEFMVKFREEQNFNYNNLEVKNDFSNIDIEVK
ncbi:MAG: hypothetical protein LBT75_03190 [Bacilli bacterium]|jgi:hypothetical protein|nr:hypothetical protein [Bacilli bacterium]